MAVAVSLACQSLYVLRVSAYAGVGALIVKDFGRETIIPLT